MEELSGVLADAHLKKGLRYFCNEELNMENLLFYEQVELYRRGTESQAKKLCKAFVREGSPSEVNITSKQRTNLVGAIDGKDAVGSGVFDEAQKEILSIMAKDIFPRYMQSPVCRGLLHSRVNLEFGAFVKEVFESTKVGGAKTSPAPSSPSKSDSSDRHPAVPTPPVVLPNRPPPRCHPPPRSLNTTTRRAPGAIQVREIEKCQRVRS